MQAPQATSQASQPPAQAITAPRGVSSRAWVLLIGGVALFFATILTMLFFRLAHPTQPENDGNKEETSLSSKIKGPSHEQELLPRVQEFTLEKKGEQERTVHVGPGTYHVIQANKQFLAHSATKGSIEMGTRSDWQGAAPDGLLLIEAKEDGTKVTFIREW